METAREFVILLLGYILDVDFSSGFTPEVTWGTAHALLGYAGAGMSAVGFLLPCFTTMVDIHHDQDVGNRSPVPYIANVMNCFLWIIYGCSAKGNFLIVAVNTVGLASQGYCLVKFLFHSEDHDRQWWFVFLVPGCVLVALIVLFYSADVDRYKTFFSWACALCRCLPAIAPFQNLRVVNRDRDMNSMPSVLQCGIALATAISWAGFGSTIPKGDGSGPEMDGFILGPSVVGIVCVCLQLLLHIILRGGPAV